MNEQWLLLSVEYDEGVLGLLSWRVLAVYPIDKVSQFDKCSFKAAVVVICEVICRHGIHLLISFKRVRLQPSGYDRL